MDFRQIFKMCCAPNKESTTIKDEFYFNNNISNNETKERNNEDNIDFTFYTKNQNHEMLENTVIPLNAKTNNQEINVIFDNVEQLKKEAASEDIKINKQLNKNPETEINEFNDMGIEKILSKRKSKEFINLIEKENNNLINGTDNATKTNFPSAKFTFHNESSIINNKTVFTQENTFSEVKKEKTEMNKKIDESSYIDNINTNRFISEDDIQKANIILLEEIEGNLLRKQTLLINASGLMNGERNAKDGIVFFGNKLKKGDNVINDYVLNTEVDDNSIHTFIIYYKKDVNKYYLKSYKERDFSALALVLIRIDENLLVKKKQIIKIGENYFQINPLPDDSIEIIRLESKNQEKLFYKLIPSDSPITIGRNKKCKIAFPDDKSFSRVQTTIFFENGGWYIKDGFDKSSTNGTWLYAQSSYELQHDTVFRVQNSMIRISFKDNAIYSFLKHVTNEK